VLARVTDGHVSARAAQHSQEVFEQAPRATRLYLGKVLTGEARLCSELALRQATSGADLGDRAPEIFA
jgi:hypothetical protein